WQALGSGLNNIGTCMAEYNGNIYVGGFFTQAGGRTATYIAKWDGTAWSAVGGGLNSHVDGMIVYNGELYVGGEFTMAGGNPAKGIAKWNDTRWDTVGAGINGSWVGAFGVYNNNLYVGGEFTKAGRVSASHIAQWDGTTWSALGKGIRSGSYPVIVVEDICSFNGNLIATGMFDSAGTYAATGIAQWDGSNWTDIGGVYGEGAALGTYNGMMYVGGAFSSVSVLTTHDIAAFDGFNWHTVAYGVNHPISRFIQYDNLLYLGGTFYMAGSVPASHIAAWDGNTFTSAGTGTDTTIYGFATLNGDLYATGLFTHAGGIPASYVAKWSVPGAGIKENKMTIRLSVYPNPGDGLYTLHLQNQMPVQTEIRDVCGQLIYSAKTSGNNLQLDLSDKAPGIYFCQVWSIDGQRGNLKIIQR
ncbi:MAG TPA: T9SS type A sorting domain-containing protein, partial [Bacteroidia bacterium]|nr:T9SS type A sorting domain-containing protein [Bacteroidia bacterium]